MTDGSSVLILLIRLKQQRVLLAGSAVAEPVRSQRLTDEINDPTWFLLLNWDHFDIRASRNGSIAPLAMAPRPVERCDDEVICSRGCRNPMR